MSSEERERWTVHATIGITGAISRVYMRSESTGKEIDIPCASVDIKARAADITTMAIKCYAELVEAELPAHEVKLILERLMDDEESD